MRISNNKEGMHQSGKQMKLISEDQVKSANLRSNHLAVISFINQQNYY